MWIRSQNGEELIEVNRVNINDCKVNAVIGPNPENKVVLGVYTNEERSMEVLNNIQRKLMNGVQYDKIDNFGERVTRLYVFQMPKR